MRDASVRSESTSIVRHEANGNASCETSSEVSDARMSRARGPHRPSVVHDEVRSVICAEPSSGRWSAYHLRSAMPCAPPVTTRKRSSPSRITVRSLLNVPLGLAAVDALAVFVEQLRVRLVPVRALPAGCLVEDGPELTLA